MDYEADFFSTNNRRYSSNSNLVNINIQSSFIVLSVPEKIWFLFEHSLHSNVSCGQISVSGTEILVFLVIKCEYSSFVN